MNLLVNIKKKYKNFTLSVNIESQGNALGLLGASGSGKSMTLRCIAGIETPDHGCIRLNDQVVFDSEQGINIPPRYRNIGLLFQNYALFPHMTVNENIKIGMKDKANHQQRLQQLLAMFSIENLQNCYPWQLSGGEQQRVAMARLLAYEPELLLLDEPFSALDTHLKEELFPELKAILSDYGKDIILVSHSKGELYQFCDSIAVLDHGAVVEYGPKCQIFGHPEQVSTARLIGCRNISRIKRIGEYELMALDWNLCLKTMERISEEIRFIGICGNRLKLTQSDDENTIPVELVEVLEGPKEVNLIYHNSKILDDKHRFHLTLAKDEWDNLTECRRGYLHFPKEHLLLLK